MLSEVDWLHAAGEVAKQLRVSGAERDQAGQPPFAEVDQLRAVGLLPILEPVAVGGGGGTWAEAMRVVRTVAAGDMSIGQLLGFHYFNARTVEFEATPEQYHQVAAAAVRESWFWAGAMNPRDPDVVLAPEDSGYRMRGRKTFATGTGVADRILVRVRLGEVNRRVHVPRHREGIRVNDDWDNMGQRLTMSGSIEFDDVAVAADELLGVADGSQAANESERPPRSTLSVPMIQLMFTNLYVGAARGALEAAMDYTRTSTRPWISARVDSALEDPYILERYGQMSVDLHASEALADAAAAALQDAIGRGHQLTHRQRGETAIAVYRAKAHSTQMALEVTSTAFEVTGARATSRRHGFDRYWRNVRTHTLHDPVAYKIKEVGDFLLNDRIPEPTSYS